jgi:hypothetical protein
MECTEFTGLLLAEGVSAEPRAKESFGQTGALSDGARDSVGAPKKDPNRRVSWVQKGDDTIILGAIRSRDVSDICAASHPHPFVSRWTMTAGFDNHLLRIWCLGEGVTNLSR